MFYLYDPSYARTSTPTFSKRDIELQHSKGRVTIKQLLINDWENVTVHIPKGHKDHVMDIHYSVSEYNATYNRDANIPRAPHAFSAA